MQSALVTYCTPNYGCEMRVANVEALSDEAIIRLAKQEIIDKFGKMPFGYERFKVAARFATK